MKTMHKAHPWHGVSMGHSAPAMVNAYIEIVPTDTVKYEIDKESGHLRIDRPQKYSNFCPALYGFIPQTYCGKGVGQKGTPSNITKALAGDHDPLDICVLTEKVIAHGDIIVNAVPIGGLRMIDKEEVDDKIIAVLYEDAVYGAWKDLSDAPETLIERLKHYFLTYKHFPGDLKNRVELGATYGAQEAQRIIEISAADYQTEILHID